MIFTINEEVNLPWGEILTALGSLVVLLLTIGNNKLKKLLAETKPNGGASLRDKINKIEQLISNLSMWIEAERHLSDRPMFMSDSDGNFIWVNNAFVSLTGRSMDSLRNLGWVSSIAKEDRQRVSEEWEESVRDKRLFQSDFQIISSDSEIKNVRARACPTKDTPYLLGYLGYWIVLEEI